MDRDNNTDEFLNNWFPDLDKHSYIIPVAHLDYIDAIMKTFGNVPVRVLNNKNKHPPQGDQTEIKEHDEAQHKLHDKAVKFQDKEVMVMMMQTNCSMYSSLTEAVGVSLKESSTGDVPLENILTDSVSLLDISCQKKAHSDLVIVNKHRGVLVGVVQSVHGDVDCVARPKLEQSVRDLEKRAVIVEKVVGTVPGADNVLVRKTLVLTNITRKELGKQLQLQTALQGVSCLCKDEMDTEEGLKHWWQISWSSGHRDFMNSHVYRQLVAKFAIPATRVEIYLTTQPRLRMKHEHDVVNAVGDVHGAQVFQAGLHQLSLFPTQAELLDLDKLDDSKDDVKFLWGPPGTGKTILLVLRALQWMKHFSAQQIVILQTRQDGTAASCLVEYQLQQTLNAQQQRARQSGTDTQSAQCTFTHVDMSGLWRRELEKAADSQDEKKGKGWKVVLKEGCKEKLYTALGLQQRGQSDTAIHIVADEADGYAVAAVYQWLKDNRVTTIRLWVAAVHLFRDKENIPASLQHAVCHVTEPLRCPGPVVQEVMGANQIKRGDVPRYDVGWQLTDGPAVVQLQHYGTGRDGHTGRFYPWRCGLCVKKIAARLRSLHVGEADKGRHGLSANDVFILGSLIDCNKSDDDELSPAPLIKGLQDNGYNVRTLSSTSARDEVMAVATRDVTPPAVTVAHENCVWGLERKVVVYCDTSSNAADVVGRLRAFSRSTSLLVHIMTDW